MVQFYNFYNPITSSYYRPPAFRLDESRLPITNFPNYLRFDGGLTCGLLRKKTDTIHDPFPPGTHVSIQHKDIPTCGTINNILIPLSPILKTEASPVPEDLDEESITSEDPRSPPYFILLYNGIIVEQSYDNLIKYTRYDKSTPKSPINAAALEIISHFLCHDSKVTMDHKGAFHKGYINYSPETGFQFIVRINARSRKVDFSVPIPYFKQHWTTLLGDDRLFTGYSTVSYFLRSATSDKNPPSLNYVSAKHLISPCPPSLFKALYSSNPDIQVWMGSYQEEKARSYRP